jgi:hypothetical protein
MLWPPSRSLSPCGTLSDRRESKRLLRLRKASTRIRSLSPFRLPLLRSLCSTTGRRRPRVLRRCAEGSRARPAESHGRRRMLPLLLPSALRQAQGSTPFRRSPLRRHHPHGSLSERAKRTRRNGLSERSESIPLARPQHQHPGHPSAVACRARQAVSRGLRRGPLQSSRPSSPTRSLSRRLAPRPRPRPSSSKHPRHRHPRPSRRPT